MDLDDETPPQHPEDHPPQRKWREWHEREVPVNIHGSVDDSGIRIDIESRDLTTHLLLTYPEKIWSSYVGANKRKLVDNITYIFTAHLPFLLKGNIRLEYSTGYPQCFSWANQCFMRSLPSYWYVYRGRHGSGIFPMLKTLLNSRAIFSPVQDEPPSFPTTNDDDVVIPFTFGKDSFLTYYLAKELGLRPHLVYFNEPTEAYAREHKLQLIKDFSKETGEEISFMDNPLGHLREYGEGWFGWELALTSWTLLAMPYAYATKSGYILFSNEKSVNDFFYDDEGFKVLPDYEQSAQATEEQSLLSQALSEGEVYVTTFLQGLNDLGIVAILKDRYGLQPFHYLMSCWAETPAAANKRWCAECTKCARLYIYMLANGIDPKDAGFQDDMLQLEKKPLYNVFDHKASGTGWDAFGLNLEEQALAFYLAILRGHTAPLLEQFRTSRAYDFVETHFDELVEEYYGLHPESVAPLQWKKKIDTYLRKSLKNIVTDVFTLQAEHLLRKIQ